MQAVGDVQETRCSLLSDAPLWLGVLRIVQLLPSHCSANVVSPGPPRTMLNPTAMQYEVDGQETPVKTVSYAWAGGAVWTLQALAAATPCPTPSTAIAATVAMTNSRTKRRNMPPCLPADTTGEPRSRGPAAYSGDRHQAPITAGQDGRGWSRTGAEPGRRATSRV